MVEPGFEPRNTGSGAPLHNHHAMPDTLQHVVRSTGTRSPSPSIRNTDFHPSPNTPFLAMSSECQLVLIFCSGFHVFKSPHFTASGLKFATLWDKCQMAQHSTRPFEERGHAFSVSPAPGRNLHSLANHGHKSSCLSRQRVRMWDIVNLLAGRTRRWTTKSSGHV